VITIPVTVATAEKSFSKQKLNKNYFRATMGQERLRGLSVLSVEHEEAQLLRNHLQDLVKLFAKTKARRSGF
jgi:hAT family C-terminal dimerisation region